MSTHSIARSASCHVSGGGKRFVDNLLEFSSSVPPHQLQLGIDYSAEWTDASTLTITSSLTITMVQSDVVPSFILLAVQGNKVVTYVYELKDGEVAVSKSEYTKKA